MLLSEARKPGPLFSLPFCSGSLEYAAILQLHQHHVVLMSVDQRVELALFELRETVQQLRPFYRAVIHLPELLNQELFRPLLLFRTAWENASIEQTA